MQNFGNSNDKGPVFHLKNKPLKLRNVSSYFFQIRYGTVRYCTVPCHKNKQTKQDTGTGTVLSYRTKRLARGQFTGTVVEQVNL